MKVPYDFNPTDDEKKRYAERMKSIWESYRYTAPEDTAKIQDLFYRAFVLGAAMVLESQYLADITQRANAQAEAQVGAKL